MTALTPTEAERYARHILLKEIGGAGQQRLKAAHVAIVGVGGLGAPAALYLAAAGVGRLTLIDDDGVSLSNLQRQILFRAEDVGKLKTDVGADALAALNPHVEIARKAVELTALNAQRLLAGADVVLDGTDDYETRFAVNDACHALGAPLVSGAVGRWDGQVAVFASGTTKGKPPEARLPCYRCLVPETPPDAEHCAQTGVVGALTGVIGAAMALEAIKLITGAGKPLTGRLMLFDGLTGESRTVKLSADPACAVCGAAPNWGEALIAAARADLETRRRLAADGSLFDGYHPEMEAVHLANAALLERAVAAIGWPGRSVVGDEAAHAAFLILQHAIARPDLQRRGLEWLLDAIPRGDANPLDAAYLADRIAVFEGRPQVFGTQFDWFDGALGPSPVSEPENLDERRASVGLPPIAEAIAAARDAAAADGETAPPDLAARKAAFEQWARRVGWR